MKIARSPPPCTNRFATFVIALGIAIPLTTQAQSAGHSREESRYILKDLGTFGGHNGNSNGGTVILNNMGTIVGGADTANLDPLCACPVVHAFNWNRGPLHDLGTLPKGDNFSFAIAINNSGVIAGVSDNGVIDPQTGETFVATVWQRSGKITNLGTLGGLWSLPTAINECGQIVGGAENTIPDPDGLSLAVDSELPAPTLWHATLWQNGTIEDLGTLGGPASFAYYINAMGQIAGVSYTNAAAIVIHPFIWENGQMADIPTLGGDWSDVAGMNNRGQVVGRSATRSGEQHAYRWSKGRLIDLGTLGGNYSFATAINDKGWIVGGVAPRSTYIDGFIWHAGVMTDLGKLYGRYRCNVAFSINVKGQVVGQSDTDCGENKARAWIWENGGPWSI